MGWSQLFKIFTTMFMVLSTFILNGQTFEEVKSEINSLHQELENGSKSDLGWIYYKLAKAYYHDQEIDKAFQYFLLSLKNVEPKTFIEPKDEEKKIYEEALDFYLTQSGIDPIRAAKEILEKYEDAAKKHKDFFHLNFLMSTAYANLGKYEEFFDTFYSGYPYLHDSFLTFKTQGILYLRLSHHARSEEERYGYQEEACRYLNEALTKNPKDPTLYKVLIFLAKDEKNDLLVLSYLQKMVRQQAFIPRGDIYLYVREAVGLGEHGLAQEIIDRAQNLYEYSRAIAVAQEYLNQHKG